MFKSFHPDHTYTYNNMTTTKFRKSKKIKFGLFKTEADARAELSRREKQLSKNVTAELRVVKIKRHKEGKRSWLAYALVKKKVV